MPLFSSTLIAHNAALKSLNYLQLSHILCWIMLPAVSSAGYEMVLHNSKRFYVPLACVVPEPQFWGYSDMNQQNSWCRSEQPNVKPDCLGQGLGSETVPNTPSSLIREHLWVFVFFTLPSLIWNCLALWFRCVLPVVSRVDCLPWIPSRTLLVSLPMCLECSLLPGSEHFSNLNLASLPL